MDAQEVLRDGRRPDGISADCISKGVVARHRHPDPAATAYRRKRARSPGPTAAAPATTAYTAEVVRFNPTNEADLDQYKGKLKGKIVLLGDIRELKPHFDP